MSDAALLTQAIAPLLAQARINAVTLPDLNEFDEFRLVNFYYGRRS